MFLQIFPQDDVFIIIDETHALNPLHMKAIEDKDLPETFPTGE